MNGETHSTEQDHEQRVQRVLARAQRETTARDLLTFSIANVWVVLVALGAAVFALIHTPPSNTASNEPLDTTEPGQ